MKHEGAAYIVDADTAGVRAATMEDILGVIDDAGYDVYDWRNRWLTAEQGWSCTLWKRGSSLVHETSYLKGGGRTARGALLAAWISRTAASVRELDRVPGAKWGWLIEAFDRNLSARRGVGE